MAGSDLKVSVLVPFRGDDGGWRDRLWNYCRAAWESLPYELVVGQEAGQGPFNTAMAFNDAASRASGDIFVLWGADQIPDAWAINAGVSVLEAGEPWRALFAGTAGFSRADTEAILAGANPWTKRTGPVFDYCTGILAVHRDAWIKFDERFEGWGCEDTAHRKVLESLYGPSQAPTGVLRCLWHPPASHVHFDRNAALLGEYMAAESAGTMIELVERLGLR